MPVLLIMTLFMGKRQVGELPVFDFIVAVTIGAIAGADIADPSIHHGPTAFAIIALALFQIVYSVIILKNRTIGKLMTFEPTIVIQQGKIRIDKLKKLKYTIDTLLHLLREKDIFDLNEVDFAIVEANGKISVLKKDQNKAVTKKDMTIISNQESLSLPLIVEGNLYKENLSAINMTHQQLMEKLEARNIRNLQEVFYCACTLTGELYVSSYNDNYNQNMYNLRH
jgi:uncharacterized membrane protein YcaP (DUF421 family)